MIPDSLCDYKGSIGALGDLLRDDKEPIGPEWGIGQKKGVRITAGVA
jgi:hypothetical protein